MKRLFIIIIALIAAVQLGWMLNELVTAFESAPSQPVQRPQVVSGVSPEVHSPKDRVSESQIHVLQDKVVLDIRAAQWSRFTDTNSMDPLLDAGSNAIQVVPQTPDDIQIGDIISYASGDSILIHRVISIGKDDYGWYAIAKGDNNNRPDPSKVRFPDIRRVVVGIIY